MFNSYLFKLVPASSLNINKRMTRSQTHEKMSVTDNCRKRLMIQTEDELNEIESLDESDNSEVIYHQNANERSEVIGEAQFMNSSSNKSRLG